MLTDKVIYDLCLHLKKNGIQQSRKDEAYYFVTPEILTRVMYVDSLFSLYRKDAPYRPDINRDWEDLFEKLVYYPTEADLLGYLGSDLQQIQRMSDFTFFSYVEPDYEDQEAYRGRGDTVWASLVTVIIGRFEQRKARLLENKPKQDESTK